MKWTKETKYYWCSAIFGFPINPRFYLGFFFSFLSLKVQFFHHSGIFNFSKPLPICVPFSQLEVEPGFDKHFHALLWIF